MTIDGFARWNGGLRETAWLMRIWLNLEPNAGTRIQADYFDRGSRNVE
jgi:hypothetical protein